MASHGDIREISYSHPTLGTGVFFGVSNQTGTLDQGGYRTSDDANQIASDGSPIYQVNQVRGSFECVIEADQNIREDQAKLIALAASPDPAEWTISFLNGTVWKGSGKPVGDIQADTNTGNLPLKISGGQFRKIVG